MRELGVGVAVEVMAMTLVMGDGSRTRWKLGRDQASGQGTLCRRDSLSTAASVIVVC
jgi:hypothetical protein